MKYFATLQEGVATQGAGHVGYLLLTEGNGCRNGCSCGISYYTETEYPSAGRHDDQEGFVVLSGNGKAKVGKQEEDISPGTVFIVPPHEPHSIRTIDSDVPVVVFWFHAAV